MSVTRRPVLRRIAQEIGVENPETITYGELSRKIDEIPEENWAGINPYELRVRLATELDGARPLF